MVQEVGCGLWERLVVWVRSVSYNPRPTSHNLQRALALRKIQRSRALQLGFGHERRTAFVFSNGDQNVADVGRITGAQLGASFAHAQLAEIFGAVRFARNVEASNHTVENLIERLLVHGVHENLVVNTAQEGFVSQIAVLEVAGENNHRLEGDLELNAVAQYQLNTAAAECSNPATTLY